MLQIPEVLYTLVNLSRLNLAGSKLGPAQGRQLEERLRLDTLAVNADAVAPVATDSAPTPDDHTTSSAQPESRREGHPQRCEQDNATRNSINSADRGRKCISRPTSVPDHRLPEIRDKVRVPKLRLLRKEMNIQKLETRGIRH